MSSLPLTEVIKGGYGKVTAIKGGQGMKHRVSILGIVNGAEIKKVSQHALKGPVVIEVGRTQVALGHGMASRIFIKPLPDPE